MEIKKVTRVADAHFAHCRTCGLLPTNPYWGPSTTRSLHRSGMGHKVDLMAVAR